MGGLKWLLGNVGLGVGRFLRMCHLVETDRHKWDTTPGNMVFVCNKGGVSVLCMLCVLSVVWGVVYPEFSAVAIVAAACPSERGTFQEFTEEGLLIGIGWLMQARCDALAMSRNTSFPLSVLYFFKKYVILR